MNRISNHIISILLVVVFLVGCDKSGEQLTVSNDGSDRIILRFASDKAIESRASEDGTSVESKVEKLDVFIFDEGELFYYESVKPHGATVTLGKPKSAFVKPTYSIYLVANSTNPSKPLSEIKNLTELRQVTETSTTENPLNEIDPTGENGSFLMSGNVDDVKLNDGNADVNTEININLARAAAKIEVVLIEGANKGGDWFQFAPPSNLNTFRLNNWQGVSYVLPDADVVVLPSVDLKKADPYAGNVKFGKETVDGKEVQTITMTTYSYSNDWSTGGNVYEKMTHLVVRVPYMKKSADGGVDEVVDKNYYTIPVSKTNMLKPNHLYRVRVTLKGTGAENEGEDTNLEDIEYEVVSWEDLDIQIGADALPHYLTLNRDELELHNMADDNTSIAFSSSSEVKIVDGSLKVYYYNKYGTETRVTDRQVLNEIKITPDEGLNGNLNIKSPIPTNNLIRYIEFKVWNGDEECEPITVMVKQYPQEYITYYFGWYSYRKDFGFNYESENKGNGYVTATTYNSNNDTWGYDDDYNLRSKYFGSKVAEQPSAEGYGNQSNYDISWYYWGWGEIREATIRSEKNPRMYHVQITSSALPKFPEDEEFDRIHPNVTYQLGIPRKDALGRTERDEANNNLVSPSFMIASRLGFISGDLPEDDDEVAYKQAASHCANYVEVYYPRDEKGRRLKDASGRELEPVVLDDWRLPTKAELLIIMRYQGTSDQGTEAMEYLLNAPEYMSAGGFVVNPHSTSTGNAIRCVRDHYVNKEINK